MAITFLDEEEDIVAAAKPPKVEGGITFLDEEELKPATPAPVEAPKITFLDEKPEAPSIGGLAVPPAPEVPKFEATKPSEGVLRQAADLPVQFAIGINNSVKGLSDLFGADNPVSQNLSQNVDWYRGLLSAASKQDEEEVGRILQEAEGKGIIDQLGAGLEAFSVAPADFVASGLGSLAVFAAGGLAGRAAGLGAKGIQAVQAGLGAGMGAGVAKGEIYQSVKDEMLAQGKTEEEAKGIAMDAQSFGGKNLDQILLGAGLGTIDALTGAEKIIGKVLAKGGLKPDASRIGNILKNGITEAAPEFVQAAQEKFASNLALQREGVDVSLTQGVFSQGALEGLVGLGLGVGAGAIEPRIQTEPTKEEVSAAAAETQDVARRSMDVAPATASLVEGEAEQLIIAATVTPRREGETDAEWRARTERERAETPEQRVARLQREAQEAAGIELEEEGAGLPPVEPTPPVTPTPEAAVAPVEPVVAAEGAVEPTAVAAPTEPVTPTEPTPAPAGGIAIPQSASLKISGREDTRAEYARLEAEGMTREEAIVELQSRREADKKAIRDSVAQAEIGDIIRVTEDDGTVVDYEIGADITRTGRRLNVKRADGSGGAFGVEVDAGVPAHGLIAGGTIIKRADWRAEQEAKAAPTPEAAPAAVEPTPVTPPVTPEADPAIAAQKAIAASEISGRTLGINKANQGVEQAREVAYNAKQEASLPKIPVDRAIQVWEAAGNETKYGEPEFAAGELRFAVSGGYDKATNEVKLSNNPKEFSSLTGDSALTPRSVVRHELGHWALFNQADNDLVGRLFEWADTADRTQILDPWHGGRAGVAYPKAKFDSRDELVSEAYSIWKSGGTVPQEVIPMLQELDALVPQNLQDRALQFADEHSAKLSAPTAIPQLEPLRRVARAEQTEEDVSGLVDAGFVEVYNGQPVLTQAGLDALPEAERPRLTTEARKIQIDTRTSEAAAEAISKNLRIGVDQVPFDVKMPTGWKLVEDIYVPPTKMQRIEAFDIGTVADVEETADVFASVWGNRPRVDTDKILSDARTKRAKKPFTTKSRPLTPKEFLNKPVRFAMKQAALFNFDENTRKGDRVYADIAAILAESPIDALDNEDIVTLSSRNRRGRERRFWGGDIGMASTKGMSIKTFIHEVGHSLTADQLRKYAPKTKVARPINGKEYIDQLKKSSQDENVPEPVRRIFTLYISTIEQLGLMDLYGRKGGLAGTPNPDVSMNNALELQSKGQIDQKFTRDDFYALANVYEFVSQTFTGSSFRNKLKELKSPINSRRTIWQDIVSAIRQILGLPTDSMAAAVIEASIDISMEIPASRAAARRDMNIVADKMLQAFNSIRDLFPSGVNKKVDEFAEIIDEGINPWVWRRGVDDWNSYWPTVRMTLDSVLRSAAKQTGMPNYQQKIAEARKLINDAKQIKLNQYSKADIGDLAPPEVDIWKAPEQEITSQETSINERKIPAVFNQVKEWTEGTVNADIGGGRFDNVTNWLRERGVTNLIIDWFNRDRAFNETNIDRVRGGQADTATISNVLNVIQEPDARDLVIRQAADAIKEGGTAYFYIYEGNGSGDGRATSKGWQENRKASTYIDEVSRHFGNVERRNQMIIAKDPIKEAEPMAMEEAPEVPIFTEGTPEAATLKEMEASMAKVDAASEAKGGKPETYKISEIASVWMDSGLGERELQDAIVEYTNLTPANAARVAKAINRQYNLQQRIAEAGAVIAEIAPEPEGAPRKSSVTKLIEQTTGVRKPVVKLQVSESAALKKQIQLKAREARETRKARKEAAEDLAKSITDYVKANPIRGPINSRQAMSITKKALKLDVNNEAAVDRFEMYVERVIENANYDRDLADARSLIKRAKAFARAKGTEGNVKVTLEAIANVAPTLLNNPFEFNLVVQRYLLGLAPVTAKQYAVMPDADVRRYLESLETQIKDNQEVLDRSKAQRILDKQAAYAEEKGIPLDEAISILNSEEFLQEKTIEKLEDLTKLLTAMAQESQKDVKAYDDSGATTKQKELISFMRKVNLDSLINEEKKRYIRFANNLLANGATFGMEQFQSIALGQEAAMKAAKDKRLSNKLAAWISPIGGDKAIDTARRIAAKTQSEADTFKNIFGREAVGVFRNILGLNRLDVAQTDSNRAKEQIANEFGEYFKGLRKKYGDDATGFEAKGYAGIAGYLIQTDGNKTEAESIPYRRRLMEQNIVELRKSDKQADLAEADLKERALAQLTGATNAEILSQLQALNPASYEQLMWVKDVMLPKWRDFLKEHDENFRNQANNYNNPDHLTITYKFPEGQLLPSEMEDVYQQDMIGMRIKQAANSIKRKDHPNLPVSKAGTIANIDINFGYNQYNALVDQVDKAFVAPAWEQVVAFTKAPEFEQVMGGRANALFVKNLLRDIQTSRSRQSLTDDEAQLIAGGVRLARKISTQAVLGGFTQPLRQVPDQLSKLFFTTGRFDLITKNLLTTAQAAPLLNKFPIGRRGDAQAGTQYASQFNELARKVEASVTDRKWAQYRELMNKVGEFWMTPLRGSDVWAAKLSWMSYYEAELNKKGIKMESWEREAELVDTDQDRKEAAAYAEFAVDFYGGASDPTKMASLSKQTNNGWKEFAKLLFLPLNSFALQQKNSLISDLRDAYLRTGDRKASIAAIAGTLAGMAAFHGMRIYIIGGLLYPAGKALLMGIFGIDMDEPDEEEKQKQLEDNWRKFKASMYGNIVAGGLGEFVEKNAIDAVNRTAYLWDANINPDSLLNDKGEFMSFRQYEKEISPLYRFRSYGSSEYSFGLADVLTEQATHALAETQQLMTPEEMEKYTGNEQAYAAFATGVEWMYFFRLMDTDVKRIATDLKRQMDKEVKEREAEIRAIRNR